MPRPWFDPNGNEYDWSFSCAYCGTVYVKEPDPDRIIGNDDEFCAFRVAVMKNHTETLHGEELASSGGWA